MPKEQQVVQLWDGTSLMSQTEWLSWLGMMSHDVLGFSQHIIIWNKKQPYNWMPRHAFLNIYIYQITSEHIQ